MVQIHSPPPLTSELFHVVTNRYISCRANFSAVPNRIQLTIAGQWLGVTGEDRLSEN